MPQTQLDGNARPMPQGKVLGGGSILNAMCWNRGGADDYDTWEALGNPGWGWEGLLPYFMKASTANDIEVMFANNRARVRLTLPYTLRPLQKNTQSTITLLSMVPRDQFKSAIQSTSIHSQVSFRTLEGASSLIAAANLFAGMNLLGLHTQFDPNDGTSAGPALVPTDLDPNNQTRSDARRTYYDPYVGRANFHVITGQHVTRVLTDGVGGNGAVTNPTSGGNSNGNGPSSGNNDGFGFGPGGSTPPLPSSPPSSRFARRQDPASSSLRITGVEVGHHDST